MIDVDSGLGSATNLASGLDRGSFSAVELTKAVFDTIDRRADPGVFIALTRERALQEAQASDDRRVRGACLGAWDGIPVAWKDLFDLQGVPTTAGSAVYRDRPPAARDADVVAACAAQGLVAVGKTNLSEFAYSGLGLNPHFGTPPNPFSPPGDPRAPGGSSAGSAVAVAAGLVPAAIGTDTAGSVRVPASFCGIWGFKASQNRYAMAGVFPLSSSLDSLGAFANGAADLCQIDAFMRGRRHSDIDPTAIADIRIVVPDTVVFDDVSADIVSCFETLVQALAEAGVAIERGAFPIFAETDALFRAHGTLTVAEAYTLHEALLNSPDADRMDRHIRARLQTALDFTVQDYIRLQWSRSRLEAETRTSLGNRFLLFPTTPITAPAIAPLASDETFRHTNLLALRNTMLGNYLAMPGVSMPIGVDGQGLPVGALLSAAPGGDTPLLAAARALEARLGHAVRPPTPAADTRLRA